MTRGNGILRSIGLGALVFGVLVGSSISPGNVALAQDGPRFSDWGPGKSPPEQEGADRPSADAKPEAAPYGAPSAAPAPAPGPDGSSCQYDLSGSWWNQGRQTSGRGSSSYSASVQVRQYRSYLYAQQDDGTSYYGRCYGTRLQFDVYAWSRFVGYQDGWISSGPRPLSGPPSYEAPAAAAAPPPPENGTGTRATFTWSTWYGSGSETWTRSSRYWEIE